MSRLTQQSGDDNRYILVAKLDNARNLHSILKAVQFKEVKNFRFKNPTHWSLDNWPPIDPLP